MNQHERQKLRWPSNSKVTPDLYVLGGGHHGGVSIPTMETVPDPVVILPETQHTDDERKPLRHSSRVILVDPLPSHFPGGGG